jgi:hypothetical protein
VSRDGCVCSSTGVPHAPQKRKPGLRSAPQTAHVRFGAPGAAPPEEPIAWGLAAPDGWALAIAARASAAEPPCPSSDRPDPQRLHVRAPIGLKVRHPSQTNPTSMKAPV